MSDDTAGEACSVPWTATADEAETIGRLLDMKRIAVVGTLSLLAGILGIWSAAIAAGANQEQDELFSVGYSNATQFASIWVGRIARRHVEGAS